jgi:hypothetical protein
MIGEIKNILNNLNVGKYIKKSDKDEIKEIAKKLKEIRFRKIKDKLEELIESSKYSKKQSDDLKKLCDVLIDDDVDVNIKCDKMEDMIKIIEDENFENELDEECNRYNKYTKQNPAKGITYDKENKRYVTVINNKEKRTKNLEELVERQKEIIFHKKEKIFPKKMTLKNIMYKNKKIIIYMHDGKAYFDINHIVNLCSEKSQKEKYDKYKSKIVLYSIKDNEHGGFFVKEFIIKKTFFDMLLHSNSVFSNKFKDDVSKIIDQLTDNGIVVLENNSLKLDSGKIMTINDKAKLLTDANICDKTYENIELVDFIRNELVKFKNVGWNKYCDKHIMYFCILTIDDPIKQNRILCKVGYSADFVERMKSLVSEYKCKIYLMGLKTVKKEQDEKLFHSLLKKKFCELVVDVKINNHDKDEIYVFDERLYSEFLKYENRVDFSDDVIKLEKETDELIQEYFENLDVRFEKEVIIKMRCSTMIEKVTTELQKDLYLEHTKMYFDHINMIEQNRHKEKMKDKEIELKKLELEIIKIKK